MWQRHPISEHYNQRHPEELSNHTMPFAPGSIFYRALQRLQPVEVCMRKIVDTHCAGILNNLLHEHLNTGGRRIRSLLVLAAAEVLGTPLEASIGWAAACELLHNATLVHDDIQDGDEMRRGRPALWFKHGTAHAINAGDFLLISPVLAVAQIPVEDRLRWDLVEAFGQHAASIASGQAAEMKMTAEREADLPLYREIVSLKTGGLFKLPVMGAALLAGLPKEVASSICDIFSPLGILFQMQDDVLDLFGDKGRLQVGADLREGKFSALVVHHLQLHPEDKAWLKELLSRPSEHMHESEIHDAIKRFRSGGALAAVVRDIYAEAAAAQRAASKYNNPGLVELVNELVAIVLTPIRDTLNSIDTTEQKQRS